MNWSVFVIVLGEKLLQNNQSLLNFCLWGCKAAALLLMWHNIVPYYAEKSSDYAEDAHFSKVLRFAPLHPSRCPITASLSIKILISFACPWARPKVINGQGRAVSAK